MTHSLPPAPPSRAKPRPGGENGGRNPYAGTPLARWADALRESDEAMDETLAAAREIGALAPTKGETDA